MLCAVSYDSWFMAAILWSRTVVLLCSARFAAAPGAPKIVLARVGATRVYFTTLNGFVDCSSAHTPRQAELRRAVFHRSTHPECEAALAGHALRPSDVSNPPPLSTPAAARAPAATRAATRGGGPAEGPSARAPRGLGLAFGEPASSPRRPRPTVTLPRGTRAAWTPSHVHDSSQVPRSQHSRTHFEVQGRVYCTKERAQKRSDGCDDRDGAAVRHSVVRNAHGSRSTQRLRAKQWAVRRTPSGTTHLSEICRREHLALVVSP